MQPPYSNSDQQLGKNISFTLPKISELTVIQNKMKERQQTSPTSQVVIDSATQSHALRTSTTRDQTRPIFHRWSKRFRDEGSLLRPCTVTCLVEIVVMENICKFFSLCLQTVVIALLVSLSIIHCIQRTVDTEGGLQLNCMVNSISYGIMRVLRSTAEHVWNVPDLSPLDNFAVSTILDEPI